MNWVGSWERGLDIDRLHQNHFNRGSGKTMSHLAAMVGEAILGQPGNNYLYLAENYHMREWVCRDFRGILRYEGISFTPNGGYRRDEINVQITRLFVKGWKGVRTFDFMMPSELETRCRGNSWDRVFIDASAPTRIQFREGIKLLELCKRHRCEGDYYVY